MTPDDPFPATFFEHSLVARVATRSPKGRPAMTPLWFLYDRGRLFLATGRDTVAARNAAANPDVVVLLDAEGKGRSDHVLRVRGRAKVHPGAPSLRALALLGRKYYLGGWRSELGDFRLWRMRTRYYGQAEGAVIEIEPLSAELLPRP